LKLVVGLGNPGERYVSHRHNAGFLVTDHLAGEYGISFGLRKFNGLIGRGIISAVSVQIIKPQTYMNLSGVAVGQVARFFHLDPADVIVVHDDLDLSFGDIRIKIGGGDGGHKGVRSVIDHLGAEFVRVRFGIGKPLDRDLVEQYVLNPFSASEIKMVPGLVGRASNAVAEIISRDVHAAMNVYNVRRSDGDQEL
jgi:peptidyl-tRNA hydrolase, PTH1 family